MTFNEFLTVRGVRWKPHYRSGEVRLCCPFCGESKYRLGLNWLEDIGHCFHCGWSRRSSAVKAVLRELQIRPEPGLLDKRVPLEEKAPEREPLPADFTPLWSLSREDGPPFTLGLDYFLQRGFTLEDARRCRIGLSVTGRYAYRLIIPVYWERKLRSFLARSFCGREPKYLNSRGKRYIWNLDQRTPRIVLAEGVFKAMALQKAFPLLHCAASLGHSLSEEQLGQLASAGVEQVLLWPDPDAAGLLGVLGMAEQLARAGIEVELPAKIPARQADEMALATLRGFMTTFQPPGVALRNAYRFEAGRRR